ncbi:unnamed protein product [Ilex paraguariensis]|uniref:Uncharacterized protein n=1 Tax=Ilex paraguariensis TaxID=185542 RepID=A0ABC8RNM4_9AQUA
MASEGEIFYFSGPLHLTLIDWKNTHHRRSIAASLVNGVYILEMDRQHKRQRPQALAPPWWDFFHFRLIRLLVDDDDHSIFGAIYEFKFPACHLNYSPHNPPRYVIAFRGTIIEPDTTLQDLKLNLQVIVNTLQHSRRSKVAVQAVQHMVASAGAANIWLAGHSQGSVIALLAGRNMTKLGFRLETYLFNPPFFSAPIEHFKNEKLKHGVRFTTSIITAGLAVAVKGRHKKPNQTDPFSVLSGWVPYLYVNPSDPICSEYIGYFEHRDKMMENGGTGGRIERLAMQNSLGSLLLSGAFGKDSEPVHLLPTAYLTTNLSPTNNWKEAHEIRQWWRPDLYSQSKLHQCR